MSGKAIISSTYCCLCKLLTKENDDENENKRNDTNNLLYVNILRIFIRLIKKCLFVPYYTFGFQCDF